MKDIQGILPVWKEAGMTSHDCVNWVRRIFGLKKVGHGGTLDPAVSGVLPIALGRATKVLEYMLENDKVYSGSIIFGRATTTEDASGETVETKEVPSTLNRAIIQEKMSEFIGKIRQTPPMYSAVRVNGRHLYEYAREGKIVDRPSRKVEIYDFRSTSDLYQTSVGEWQIDFNVRCSKGTYIRTLAVDLGRMLDLPAHMSSLIRTEAGDIELSECVRLSTLESLTADYDSEQLAERYLLPLERALSHFDRYDMNEGEFNQIRHGALISENLVSGKSYPLAFYYDGYAIAIYDRHPSKSGFLKPRKVLRQEL